MRTSYSSIIKKYASKCKKNSKKFFCKFLVNVVSSVSGHPAGEMLPFRDTGNNLCLTSVVLGVLCVTGKNKGGECAYKRFRKCQQMACTSPQQWGLCGGEKSFETTKLP